MTSKTEVAKEVLEVAENGGMGKSSYRDLAVSDSNGLNDYSQACGLDKSYIFVNGTDEFVNDAVSEKDMIASPKSKADAIAEERGNGEQDGTNEDVIKTLNDGSIRDHPVENGVSDFGKSAEAEVQQTQAGLAKAKAGDQSGIAEGVAERGSFGDLEKSETHPFPIENPESVVGSPEFPTESAANEDLTNMPAYVNNSGNAGSGCEDQIINDECEHQVDESSVEKSRMSHVSEVGVEWKSQDVSLAHEDQEKLVVEVVEATEEEIHPSTKLDMELHTINNEEDRLNGDAKTTSQLDMHEKQQLDMSHDDISLRVLEHGNMTTDVVSSVSCHVESVNDRSLEEKSEESFASHFGKDIPYPEEPVKCNDASEMIQLETEAEVLVSDETLPAFQCENPDVETTGTVSTLPVDGKTIQVTENGLPDPDQIINGTSEVESSRHGPTVDGFVTHKEADAVVLTEKEPTLQDDEGAAESEILSDLAVVSNSQPATHDVKLEPKVHVQTFSAVTNGEKVGTLLGTYRTEVMGSFTTENGSPDNAVVRIEDVQKNLNVGDKLDGAAEDSQGNVFLVEHEVNGESGSCRTEAIDSFNSENGSVDNAVVGIEDVQKEQNMGDKFDGYVGDSQVNELLAEHDANGESETVDANTEPEVHARDFSATSTGEKTDAGLSHDNVFQEKEATGNSQSFNMKLEPEVHAHDLSGISSGDKNDIVSVAHGAEVLESSNSGNEGVADTVAVIEITKNMSDSAPTGVIHESACLQENEAAGKSDCNHKSGAESEGSMANTCFREEANVKTKTKPFNFLVRVPRLDDDNLKEQIRLAKLNVDEKTKLRDAIQVQIQEKRASNQIHGVDYEFAKEESRNVRKLVRSKRMEIESLQSMINKAKNALSIEDIDSQIHNMEHMIQHETLPLKEEKQFIREIKQLKQLREQLSSNLGSRVEIKNALEQREEVEERLKMLRKELDVLKDQVLKAEATALQAEKRYDDENQKVKELQAQFRAADDVRQSAYAQLQSLRKELSKKNKHFFKYKDAAAFANNHAFSGSLEALYCLCMDNVENFMELWNTDDEFRKEYVRSNVRSTIRRLGTFDGRSLGPDEQPTILPRYADERNGSMKAAPMKVDVVPQSPVKEVVQQEKTDETIASNDLPRPKVTEHKNKKAANKEPAVLLLEHGYDHASGGDAIDQGQEEPKKSAEEMELIRKTEELRSEDDEAKLKEQRRLEALAKADEARERKKRRAEKLQVRAELKIQKEAEEREKEREKRLRKKERKKSAPTTTDANDTNHISEAALSSESAPEIPNASPKKPQKPWTWTKHKKSKSVPPPLRNRNKKKLQQWMWVVITSLIIIFLFWLGNIGVFFNKNLQQQSSVL